MGVEKFSEAKEGPLTCPGLQDRQVPGLGFKPRQSSSRTPIFNHSAGRATRSFWEEQRK